jgi:hypothetical protein
MTGAPAAVGKQASHRRPPEGHGRPQPAAGAPSSAARRPDRLAFYMGCRANRGEDPVIAASARRVSRERWLAGAAHCLGREAEVSARAPARRPQRARRGPGLGARTRPKVSARSVALCPRRSPGRRPDPRPACGEGRVLSDAEPDTRSGANGVLEFRPFGLPAEWGRDMSAARSIPAGSAAPDQIASRR